MNTEKKLPGVMIRDVESTINTHGVVGFQPIYNGTLDVSCLAGDDLTAFIKEHVNDFVFQPIYKEPTDARRYVSEDFSESIKEHIKDASFQPIYRGDDK